MADVMQLVYYNDWILPAMPGFHGRGISGHFKPGPEQ